MSTRSTGAAGATNTRGHGRSDERTNAQWYAYVVGAVLTLVGLLGFIADASFDTSGTGDGEGGNANGQLQGDSFLGFEVNGWHNVVHLLSGLFLLSMASKRRTAKPAVIGFGVVYAIVTIIGMADGNDVLGLLPVNPADNILHLVLSLLALAAGFTSRDDDPLRRDDDVDSSRHGDNRVAGTGTGSTGGRHVAGPAGRDEVPAHDTTSGRTTP